MSLVIATTSAKAVSLESTAYTAQRLPWPNEAEERERDENSTPFGPSSASYRQAETNRTSRRGQCIKTISRRNCAPKPQSHTRLGNGAFRQFFTLPVALASAAPAPRHAPEPGGMSWLQWRSPAPHETPVSARSVARGPETTCTDDPRRCLSCRQWLFLTFPHPFTLALAMRSPLPFPRAVARYRP